MVLAAAANHALAALAAPSVDPTPHCGVPARAFDQIAGLLAETGIATPTAAASGQTLPAGTPTDSKTAAEIERVVRLWLACQNAGEPLRAWSLFTDGYLFRLLSRQGEMSAAAYDALAMPAPSGFAAAELLEIRGQRILPDGRAGATVTVAYPFVPTPKTFFFFFTRVDGRLAIDGILGEISFSVP